MNSAVSVAPEAGVIGVARALALGRVSAAADIPRNKESLPRFPSKVGRFTSYRLSPVVGQNGVTPK